MSIKIEKPRFTKSKIAMALLLVGTGLPTVGAAQDNVEVEEVVITGSNIRRKRDYDTPSPIQTLGSDDIQSAGVGQVQDILRVLPSNSGSELSASQSLRQGTSQFSLRGLGFGGTLTLINGRRAGLSPVASDQGFFYTDVNQFPTNMIQSIEVLKDGASATYGSEAVAGVVNVITRTDFEGLEIGAEYRDASNEAMQLNAAFGTSFDRGHFSTFVTAYDQSINYRGDFDWLVERSDGASTVPKDNLWDSSTGAGRYQLATADAAGNYTRSGNTVADQYCGQPNAISGLVNTFVDGSNCRYNFINQRSLIAEESRLQVFSQFDYDLSDDVKIFSEFSYSNNQVVDIIGGNVLRRTTDNGGFLIPDDHPFNYFVADGDGIKWDESAVTADPSLAVDVIQRGRPLTTFEGDLADDNVRDFTNTRIMFGFDAALNEDWGLYSYYQYARSNFVDRQPRSYNPDAYRAAIQSGDWNPFGSAWATPNAVSAKDGVTVAGNTLDGAASDLAKFATFRTNNKSAEQQVIEVILSGDLFDLSNGNTVSAAFGAQYRDFDYNDTQDALEYFQLDGRADPVFNITDASQDVYAVFAEASVPFTDNFDMQLALRYEDYGDGEGGSTTDPKIGFRLQATDEILLRASAGTSFQAPSVRNIAGSIGAGALADPIQTATAGSACDLDNTSSFNAAQIVVGGDLAPQSASNFNFGAAYEGDSINASIDYFSYDFKDLIGPGQSAQDIVSNECENGSYTPDSRVYRDAAGQLNSVTTSFINLGSVEAQGLDFALNKAFEEVLGGELAVDLQVTYLTSFDIDMGDGQTFDGAGNRNSFIDLLGSVPDLRANAGFTWRDENQNAGLFVRHIGAYDDRTPTIENSSIDSQTVLDLQYGRTFEFAEGTTDFTVGINNITDEEPPAIDRKSASGRLGYDNQVHDPRGRTIYLRLKHTF